LWFEEDGFCLTVLIGEASAALDRMIGSFDAWFLDGFAPSRNGDMWKAPLLSAIARHSRPGARLATYSVAGLVRRGLEAAGFAVERKPGFAAKRERLEARLVATPQPVELYGGAVYGAAVGPVAIVGAGIAGASLAAALARRGREAFLIDAAGAAATGASGNPAGLVMPRLDRGDTAVSRLHRAAYLAALDVYRPMGEAIFRPCAVHQKRDAATLADFASDPPMPADHLGFTPSALVHRQAGVLDPAAAARRLAGSTRLIAGDVVAIERTEAGLVLRDASGRALIEAGAVVLAAGPALRRFAQTHWLPLQRTRGQIEWGPLSRGAPASAIADGAYAAPYGDGIVFGATFDRLADEAAAGAADAQSRSRNLSALAELDPDLAAGLRVDQLTSRVGIRAATADRLPIAGLAPDADLFVKSFADVRAGRPATGPGPGLSGLYLHGGLGSRGLTLAPLLAERLASEICNEPQAIDKFALQATGAERFLLRTLRKSKLRLG
jgi:tRNA 5-methylaminomethyl-2-thiouridine biosynthesis bifunctional protein